MISFNLFGPCERLTLAGRVVGACKRGLDDSVWDSHHVCGVLCISAFEVHVLPMHLSLFVGVMLVMVSNPYRFRNSYAGMWSVR